MRLLFAADVFSPDSVGGAGRVAYHLALELSQRHEVLMVTRNTGCRFPPYERLNNGIHVHRFPVPSVSHPSFFFSEIRHSHQLLKTIWETAPPDLVCAHQSLPAFPLRFSQGFRSTPFVYCFYSPWHEEYLIKNRAEKGARGVLHRRIAFLMKIIEGMVVRRAQRVFVISQYTQSQVVDIHHYPIRRVILTTPGVDLGAFRLPKKGKKAVKTELDWPVDKLVLFTVRNLVPRMGIENLLAAFAQSSLLRHRAILNIAGDGPLRASFERMIKAFGLESIVHLLGRVPDDLLIQLYQGADFFILPTRELEGFGLVILESLACGTPVIGTPVGAIPDILNPFNPLCVCEGFTDHHIRQKLESLITSPADYRFSPEQCRRFVVDRYAWRKMGDAFEATAMQLARPGLHRSTL